jgi:hypothetical protein
LVSAVFDITVDKDRGLVQVDGTGLEPLGMGNLVWFEEVPCGAFDDFIGSIAKHIHDGTGSVEDVCIWGEV